MQGATIQDVAKAAGVSASSVSNYLNGRNNQMRPETMERIRASIEALEYSPSTVARQLKTGRTPMLGLLVPRVVNPYHAELAEALDTTAQRYGFRMVLGNGHSDGAREQAFIDELVGHGVRGIIIACEQKSLDAVREYQRRGIAFVLLDERASQLDLTGVDFVNVNNALATGMAVDHLVGLGHREIAYVSLRPQTASRQARWNGYVEAIRRHGLGEPLIVGDEMPADGTVGDTELASFVWRAAARLAQCRPRPTAIVAMNDMLAIALLAALRDQGLRVPEDISMLGVDDIQFSSLTAPALTSLRPPYAQMAEAAMQCLNERLAAPALPRREHVFAPELIVRASCLPCGRR